jgi:hypothetical protein
MYRWLVITTGKITAAADAILMMMAVLLYVLLSFNLVLAYQLFFGGGGHFQRNIQWSCFFLFACEVSLRNMCEPAPVELDIGRPMDAALPTDNCTSATQSTQECDADLSPAVENADSCEGIF